MCRYECTQVHLIWIYVQYCILKIELLMLVLTKLYTHTLRSGEEPWVKRLYWSIITVRKNEGNNFRN